MAWLIAIGILAGLCLTNLRFIRVQKARKVPIINVIKCIIPYLLSADYCAALYHKYKIKNSVIDENAKRDKLTEYISKWNRFNCIISFILAVVSYAIIMFSKNAVAEYLFFGIMIYRAVSRTMEINIAFIQDVTGERKSSNLDRNKRIKLAFASLLEEACLFIGLYVIFFKNYYEPILGGLHSFILNKYTLNEYIKLSSSWKIGFDFISVYQVLCTVVLLTISVANYISTPTSDKPQCKANNGASNNLQNTTNLQGTTETNSDN